MGRSRSHRPSPGSWAPLFGATLLLLLAGCTAEQRAQVALSITGVVPSVALPGEQVVIQGTGFGDEAEVVIGGVNATVLDASASELTVVVPEAYGYPIIEIEEVSSERLLFVGVDYDGPGTLEGVQQALDALPENAALRLPAASYAGAELDVDNRKLFGAGDGTVLDVTGALNLYTRSANTTVLADLTAAAADIVVYRGRLSTLALAIAPGVSGTVVLEGLALEVGTFALYDPDFVLVRIVDSHVAADQVQTNLGTVRFAKLQIVGSTFEVANDAVISHYGVLSVAGSSFAVGGQFHAVLGDPAGFEMRETLIDADDITIDVRQWSTPFALMIDDVAFTSATDVSIVSHRAPVQVKGSAITAVGDVQLESLFEGVSQSVEGSTFSAGGALRLGGSPVGVGVSVGVVGSSLAGAVVEVVALGGFTLIDATLTATASSLAINTFGETVIDGSELGAASHIALWSDLGSVRIAASDLGAGTSISIESYGVVEFLGGSIAATTYVQLGSWFAGDVLIAGTSSIVAGELVLIDDFNQYAGVNGTIEFSDNAQVAVSGELRIYSGYSDVRVLGNGQVDADTILIRAFEADIDVHDNTRIETTDAGAASMHVWAEFGALAVTGNELVVAGVLTVEAPAGKLVFEDNTVTALDVQTPNN